MPLHIAAERGHVHLVDFLIQHCKAALTERTADGSTLIHIASQNGHPQTALAFLNKVYITHYTLHTTHNTLHITHYTLHTIDL